MNLKIVEREDLPLLIEWNSNSEFYGEYSPLEQLSKTEWETRDMTTSPLIPNGSS